MTDQPTVALLGTGTMGAGMARNIAAAGFPLRVWNRTRAKAEPLAEAGAQVAGSAADAVRGAAVVITMLFDAESVESALTEARDGLAPGTVLVQQSTVGVAGADRLASSPTSSAWCTSTRRSWAPRSRPTTGPWWCSPPARRTSARRSQPVFDAIGSRTVWVGEAGQGTRLKLVANSWVLTVVEGIAESLSLAKALGVEPEKFLDVVKGGAMDAPYVQLKGKAMLAGDFTPSFGLDGAAKDAGLIVEAARDAGADLGGPRGRAAALRPRADGRSRRPGHGRDLPRALSRRGRGVTSAREQC